MAANDVSSKTASVYIDNQPAIEAFEQLTKKADAYNKKIDEGVKKAEFLNKAIQKSLDAGGKPERLQKQLANVNATLDKNRQELDKVTASQKALQQQIDSKTGPTLKQQAALVRKLENEYKNLGSNTDAAAKKLKELGEQSKVLTQMKQRLDAVKNAQQESAASGFFNSFFGNLGANLFLQASSAVSSFFGGMTDEAFEAEEAVDSLFNALDNANRTDLFDNLLGEADALAEEFKRLDNDDITGVFTKLIDYGKLTETQIKQLTPVIIDYAAKQKISLAAATDEITRGLEGNARGLKTYGINIKDAGTFAERF
ncbi:MAG TPA: hypothetical protein VFS22_10160, partial [Flavisolibacter sp.]|nr:hypothetical protein [Flavisolibacter sp.]